MNPSQIYNLKAKEVSKEVYVLDRHVPEVEVDDINSSLNEKVEIRYYVDYCFDGRRGWCLASVWYEGEPVMILQRAGREGSDYNERFITNKELYVEMFKYLNSLRYEDENICDVVGEYDEIDSLGNFYGHQLEEFYDEDFVPEYKQVISLKFRFQRHIQEDTYF